MATLGLLQDAVIDQGESLSSGICLSNDQALAIFIPSTWADSAPLTFRSSPDGVTYSDLYDASGNEVTFSASASQAVAVGQALPGMWLQIRSGTGALPVTQTEGATLTVMVRKWPVF